MVASDLVRMILLELAVLPACHVVAVQSGPLHWTGSGSGQFGGSAWLVHRDRFVAYLLELINRRSAEDVIFDMMVHDPTDE